MRTNKIERYDCIDRDKIVRYNEDNEFAKLHVGALAATVLLFAVLGIGIGVVAHAAVCVLFGT